MQRINLITDPLFTKLPAAPADCKVTRTNTKGIDFSTTTGGQKSLTIATVNGLQAGKKYVLSGKIFLESSKPQITDGNVYVYSPSSKSYLGMFTTIYSGLSDFQIRFVAPSDGVIQIGLHTSNRVVLRDPSLEAADTYDTGVGGGLPSFFTGDTMSLG